MKPEAPEEVNSLDWSESALLRIFSEYTLTPTKFEWPKDDLTPVVPGKVYRIGDSYWLYTQACNWEKLDGKVFD